MTNRLRALPQSRERHPLHDAGVLMTKAIGRAKPCRAIRITIRITIKMFAALEGLRPRSPRRRRIFSFDVGSSAFDVGRSLSLNFSYEKAF